MYTLEDYKNWAMQKAGSVVEFSLLNGILYALLWIGMLLEKHLNEK